jgi:hypothetical protein
VDFLNIYRNRLIYYFLVWSDTHFFHLGRQFNSVNVFQFSNPTYSFHFHISNFCVDRSGRGSQGTKFSDERRIVRQPRRECHTTRPPAHNTTHSSNTQRPAASIILCKVTYQRSEIWNSIENTFLTRQRPLKSECVLARSSSLIPNGQYHFRGKGTWHRLHWYGDKRVVHLLCRLCTNVMRHLTKCRQVAVPIYCDSRSKWLTIVRSLECWIGFMKTVTVRVYWLWGWVSLLLPVSHNRFGVSTEQTVTPNNASFSLCLSVVWVIEWVRQPQEPPDSWISSFVSKRTSWNL